MRERAGRQSQAHLVYRYLRLHNRHNGRGCRCLQDTILGCNIWRNWRELALKPSPSAIGCRPSARRRVSFGNSQGRSCGSERARCFAATGTRQIPTITNSAQSQPEEGRENNSATSAISTASPALGTTWDQPNPSRAWLEIRRLIYDPTCRPCPSRSKPLILRCPLTSGFLLGL